MNRSNRCSLKQVFIATAMVAAVGTAWSADPKSSTPVEKKPAEQHMNAMPMDKPMAHMQEDMASMKMSGDTDQDFATMMRMHHQHGIEMAQAEIANGKDAKLKGMAKKIIAAQKKEIADFDKWLAGHKAGNHMDMPMSK